PSGHPIPAVSSRSPRPYNARPSVPPAPASRSSIASQERIEPSGTVERVEFVRSADMPSVDEDLRHRHAAAGTLHHLGTPFRILDHVVLDVLHPLLGQEALGPRAVSAELGGVDLDLGHRLPPASQ